MRLASGRVAKYHRTFRPFRHDMAAVIRLLAEKNLMAIQD